MAVTEKHLQDNTVETAATFLRNRGPRGSAEQSCSRHNLQLHVLPSLPLADRQRGRPTAKEHSNRSTPSSCSTPRPVNGSMHWAAGCMSLAEEIFLSPARCSRQPHLQGSVSQSSSLLPTPTLVGVAASTSPHLQLSQWSLEQEACPLVYTGSCHFVSAAISWQRPRAALSDHC